MLYVPKNPCFLRCADSYPQALPCFLSPDFSPAFVAKSCRLLKSGGFDGGAQPEKNRRHTGQYVEDFSTE